MLSVPISILYACTECGYVHSYHENYHVGEVDCPTLDIPDNGSSSCSEETMSLEGKICNFTCDSGYQLTGSNNRTCENGNWTGSEATCTRSKTTTKLCNHTLT